MGVGRTLNGHVQGLARAINVGNAASDPSGLAVVNPVFTWVQLAQRVPVRIHIDEVPEFRWGQRFTPQQSRLVRVRHQQQG